MNSTSPTASPGASSGEHGRTKVLINLCWLVPGVVGGSEEATTNAIRALVDMDPPDIDLHLAVLRPFLDAHSDIAAALRCEVLPSDGSNKVRRIASEQAWLARQARRLGVDVVHHAGGVVPLVHPGRIVLTIHDLQPLDMPENFSWQKRLYLRTMLGRSARAADVVCVPSHFTASRVTELLGVASDRVVEVPWSLAPQQPAEGDSLSEMSGDLPNLTLGSTPDTAPTAGRYFLYPAIAYRHKRHLLLLDAFASLAGSVPEVDLLLTGAPGPLHDQVMAKVRSLGLAQRVRHLGRIPAAQLVDLYRHAEAVVLPSAYEGFGMPALEAMALDCPVLASGSGSLAEVVPPAGLVAGDDPRSWTGAMAAVLSMTPVERAEWIRLGAETANSFTPQRTASALADAYRLAGRGRNQPRES